MPSKKLGREIRTALKENPGKVVLVSTRGKTTPYATIAQYEAGVFYGECNGLDTWGVDGHFFHFKEWLYDPSYYDLMEVIGVQDVTN